MTDRLPLSEAEWMCVDAIPGWLTRGQADVLARVAASLSPGCTVVEIGSHQGRSTVVLAAAMPSGGRLVAVDPLLPDWRYGSPDTEARLRSHLVDHEVSDRVDLRRATSAHVLAAWRGSIDLVFVDGKHDVRSAVHDLGWIRHLRPGGRLLLHDAFSSVGVTLAVLVRVLASRDLRYVDRVGSLAVLEHGTPRPADRARLLAQLPWFARNAVIKVLLRLGLSRLARRCGHDDAADPY